jgi:type I restriction enzyme S subunit
VTGSLRLRNVVRRVRGTGFPPSEQGITEGELPFFKVGDFGFPGNERVLQRCSNWIQRSTASRLGVDMVPPGSLLFPKIGAALLGNARRLTSQRAVFDNNILGLVPIDISTQFLYYWMSTIDLGLFANPGPVPSLNESALIDIRLPISSVAAQRVIADFLDTETARIDALIDKKRRLIALAHERVNQSMMEILAEYGAAFPIDIAHNWRMVSLPFGWRVVRLSQVLVQLTNGYVGPTRDILVDAGVKYIQSLHIKDGEIDFNRRPFYVSYDWHSARPRIHLRAGDVLIVQTGDIGKVAVVPEEFGPASCHALQIARVRRDMLSGAFLAEYLRTPFGYESLLSRATGALHPHLEGGIRDVPVILPSKEVQSMILRRIGDERDYQKKIESCLLRQIELLRERRQALISAAVTGEMDVPGVPA